MGASAASRLAGRAKEPRMSRWTYYSPLWLGALLVLLMNDSLRTLLPRMEPWATWLIVAGVAAAVGMQCQLVMVGAQGAFAQVLPVPRGRSIRGRGAVVGGWLLIAWAGLSGVAAFLAVESVTWAATMIGVLSLVALGGVLAAYAWCLPAAQADFADDEGHASSRP
jgi:hypothetical protein